MKLSTFRLILAASFIVLSSLPSFAAPLVGSGLLPFPGATGNPPRDNYLPTGPNAGPFTGTWVGGGPNVADPMWWGTFPVLGPKPHGNPGVTGTAAYNFTAGGGYAQGVLRIGTYFVFGDLDNGAGQNESFRLRAYDSSNTLITTPWLEMPFAASPGSTAAQMPSYTFTPGTYDFSGLAVPGNPSVGVFLKNNTLIYRMEVTRTSTFASFILAAPPLVPEPSSMLLLACGTAASVAVTRQRRGTKASS
jgi:hypothetical protein